MIMETNMYILFKYSVYINIFFWILQTTDVLQLAARRGEEMKIRSGHLERNLCW